MGVFCQQEEQGHMTFLEADGGGAVQWRFHQLWPFSLELMLMTG